MTKLEKLFWSKVNKKTGTECWEWTGTIWKGLGYGALYANGINYGAHRLSWQLANKREIPEGSFICHHCDNRKCVRPSHLYAGTIYDNNRDTFNRGRHARGEMIRASHLTADDVVNIRSAHLAGEKLIPLSEKYGVTFGTIGHIVRGKTWKHVPMPSGEKPIRQGGGGKKRLTKDDVIAIRKAWDDGIDQNFIAVDFDIHPTHVALIGHRKAWRSI